MLFHWDPAKALKNLKKHGVSFEIAQTVFDDPHHLSILDSKKHGEERWITLGRSADGRTFVVVHLYQTCNDVDEVVRIISARKATKREVNDYEKGI
jgi:uncharacterized DUF497 family protein